MYKSIKTTAFAALLVSPIISTAQNQICKPANIRATTPTNQFIDHNNGTVTDKKTGLMWKRCSEGQIWNNTTKDCYGEVSGYNWQEALNHTQTLNKSGGFAGKTDWRVPNIKELISIIEEQCLYPAVNLIIFPHRKLNATWSSSPYANDKNSAFIIIEDFGHSDWADITEYSGFQIHLVRNGQ